MSVVAVGSVDACARSTAIIGARMAVLELWREDAWRSVLESLQPDLRRAIDQALVPMAWVSEHVFIDLCEAVWRVLAGESEGPFRVFSERTIVLGWGRIRRATLRGNPGVVVRGAALWRHEHTHGHMRAALAPAGGSCLVTLRDHPWLHAPRMRLYFAEEMRTIVTLVLGDVAVRETHALASGLLTVKLRWSPSE
jgi:hypothetical protein